MRSTIPCSSRNSLRWKPSGQLLADGALDDARAGEADERLGLGDVHVAEEREARRDAAGRRMEQHAR